MNVFGALRAGARFARHTPDRLLHPWRRRALLRRLRSRGGAASVLFVCHGNICRSPYAATAMLLHLPKPFRGVIATDSAGFIGPDRPSPPEAIEVAATRGVDLARHRSKMLTSAIVAKADLICVMDQRQRRAVCIQYGRSSQGVILLGDLDPLPIETRAIQDPNEQPAAVFRSTYDRIDRCVECLARTISHTEVDA